MKRIGCLLLSLVMLFGPVMTHAAAGECSSQRATVVYFVNGVWNSRPQAQVSLKQIETAYLPVLSLRYPTEKFDFRLAYNYSAGKVADVVEVIRQKLDEINDPAARNYSPEQYLNLYTAAAFGEIVLTGDTGGLISTAIENHMAARMLEGVTSNGHIQRYRTDLQEGRRVLLIAHSQGNLFASDAMRVLSPEYPDSIAMIGIASPAAALHGQTTYYTAKDDLVILAARATGSVLPANLDNDPGLFGDPREDHANHQFIDSYFQAGLASRSLLDADVFSFIENLSFPATELGSGAITVTLTWGPTNDVDLHVFEPSGEHVSYLNLEGVSGHLDLDDTNGEGPEHYFVSCDGLEAGEYRVGVNYYSGSVAQIARIQISTADGNTRSYTRDLLHAVGSSGNAAPVPVASIQVSQDAFGVWKYLVN